MEKIVDDQKSIGRKLTEDLVFMDETIAKLREVIQTEGTVEDFKQGKQQFTRESPVLKSYNNIIRRRNETYNQLLKLKMIQDNEAGDALTAFIAERIEIDKRIRSGYSSDNLSEDI